MTNIIDGMDQARFRSAVPNDNQIRNKKIEKENKKMPMVLRNLKKRIIKQGIISYSLA
ncbi:hypothetical protein GCM10020331_070930 [Ectobacillus funiculus]